MIKRSTSASGAWLLKRAGKLAKRVRAKYGKHTEIVDGYIVEGRRAKDSLVATVVDPPTMVQFVGVTSPRDEATVGFGYYTRSQLVVPSRDPFVRNAAPLSDRDVQAFQLGAPTRRIVLGAAATDSDWIGRFGGVSVSPGGIVFAPQTSTRGQFQFRVVGNTNYANNSLVGIIDAVRGVGYPVGTSAPAVVPAAYGLLVHGSFIEQVAGDGWKCMPTIDQEALDLFYGLNYTTANHLMTVPCFIHGTPLEVEDGRVVYRVFAHVMRQIGLGDPFGERALFYLDITVDTRDGNLSTSYRNTGLYRPASSADTDRHPVTSTTTRPYYAPNGMFAPSFCADGAMLVIGRTHPYVEFSNQNYWLTLVTRARNVIELPISPSHRPSRTVFSDDPTTVAFMGSDEVDGKCYFINPFHGDNSMMVIDATTGAITNYPAPFWYEAARIDLGEVLGGHGWQLNHPYVRAIHIGNGKIVFPVRAGEGNGVNNSVGIGIWDTRTGLVTAGGATPVADSIAYNRGACVACVELETEAGGDAILLLSGAGVSGGTYTGFTYVSHDSGQTWYRLSGTLGASRSVGVYGNGLYTAKPGQLRMAS